MIVDFNGGWGPEFPDLLASPSAGTSFGAAHTDDDDDRHEEFVPLEDHNMEVEQNIEEHVERHQVGVCLIW